MALDGLESGFEIIRCSVCGESLNYASGRCLLEIRADARKTFLSSGEESYGEVAMFWVRENASYSGSLRTLNSANGAQNLGFEYLNHLNIQIKIKTYSIWTSSNDDCKARRRHFDLKILSEETKIG